MSKEVRVAVTGAAGQIGYALLFRIASGAMFGPETRVYLQLLELEKAMDALEGVKMELDDCAFPLLASVVCSADPSVVFGDADWALLVGSIPRKAGMERNDLLTVNGGIFTKQGESINANAKKTCKTLVVGNPCNTNGLIALSHCKDIPSRNFFAMTMLDQHRAYAQIARKAGVHSRNIKNLAIWGNHSATQYPNFYTAKAANKPVLDVIPDERWLREDFISTVQKRGAAIIQKRGASSAASAANAIVDTVKNLTTPTPPEEFFSAAVLSDGSYNTPEGLMFSFPVRCDGVNWEIVKDIDLNDFSREKIKVTADELVTERDAVKDLLG